MTLFETLIQSAIAKPDMEIFTLPLAQVQPVNTLAEIEINRLPDGRWLYKYPDEAQLPCVIAGKAGSPLEVFCTGETPFQPNTRFLIRTAFECRFCYQSIVSMHASCVAVDDFAVAFTGPSGAGKSTRAQAWIDGLGATWISGDRPAVRLEKQGATACGVPWDGKEQIFCDVEVPLKCIMEVHRSSQNAICKLSEDQAWQLLLQQSFVPMWDTDAAAMAMVNVHHLVRKVPVYRVFCGPTPQDALEIYDILVNHPEKIREDAQR